LTHIKRGYDHVRVTIVWFLFDSKQCGWIDLGVILLLGWKLFVDAWRQPYP